MIRQNSNLQKSVPLRGALHPAFAPFFHTNTMRHLLLTLLWLATAATLTAQNTADTTIYSFADQMPYPLIRGCEAAAHVGWNEDSTKRCAEAQLQRLLARFVQYPNEAREKNIQGMVATSVVVEKDGRMSQIKVLRDIGGGCGAEAIRVIKALQEAGLRWQPAKNKGQAVRMAVTIPLRFKLEEVKPYYFGAEGDTIYHEMDSLPQFKGGLDALSKYVLNRLAYPTTYKDSCKTGVIEMALIILPNGKIKIDNQLDFNNLGMDFQFEALRLANRSAGEWIPATYQGKPVAATVPLRALFKSAQAHCKTTNDRFDQAMILANEGATLSAAGKGDEAIQKWTQALALHPDNTEILYYRGSAYFEAQKRDEACADYNRIKAILGTTWFEGIRKLVCAK